MKVRKPKLLPLSDSLRGFRSILTLGTRTGQRWQSHHAGLEPTVGLCTKFEYNSTHSWPRDLTQLLEGAAAIWLYLGSLSSLAS
jgi:hypothetical protein